MCIPLVQCLALERRALKENGVDAWLSVLRLLNRKQTLDKLVTEHHSLLNLQASLSPG